MKKFFTLLAMMVIAIAANAVETVVYSWEAPDGVLNEKGGTIAYVNGDGNRLCYPNADYYTICLNGKKANLGDATPSANAGHMVITFDEPLQAGDKVIMTAYYNKGEDKNVSAWLVFENGTTASSARVAHTSDIARDGKPADITVEVPAAADGSKTLTLTRNDSQTNMFITKLVVKGDRPTDVTPLVGNWTVNADVTVSGSFSGHNSFNFQTVKVAASETKGCVDVTIPACSYDKYSMAETQFKGLAVSQTAEGEYAIAGENLPVVVNGQTLSAKITYCSFIPANNAFKMYVDAELPNGAGTMMVVYSIVNPAIALTAEVDGATRTFEFNTAVAGEKIMIDWGDGNVVQACEGVVFDEWTYATASGVVKGEGNVKIYANGITYFDCVSNVKGASLTSLDVTNAPDLQYLYANGNVKLESVDLTKSTELLKMSLANNPTKSIDLSQCTKLTRLEMQGVAATPSALETIDLSANTELTYLQLNFNKLTTLDLSKNTKLGSIYALNNELTSVVLPESCPCTYASFNNNKLTSFDGAAFTSMSKARGTILLMNNMLTEVKNLSAKSVNVNGNYLTFATLPALDNIGTLTYNTQNDVQVAETVATLDLSAQGATTTLAVCKEDGTAQTEGVTIENGVITFDASLNGQKFYVKMTNSVYSKLTLKTTVFTVDVPVPPVVAIVKGEGTYTVTSTSETAALYYLCKPMSWLDEGETPESAALAEIEDMGSMIDSEATWEAWEHNGLKPAPMTITIANYQEMYAGEDMFLVAANVGWNGEKLAVISNIAIEYFGVPTGIKNVTAAKAINGKFIENGKLVIISNGKKFNAAGVEMK